MKTNILFQVIILNLNNKGEKSDEQILRLLSILLYDKDTPDVRKKIPEDEFGIAMTEEVKRGWDSVCNLSEAVKMKNEKEFSIRLATEMLENGEDYKKS